jgi:hypothetical protein
MVTFGHALVDLVLRCKGSEFWGEMQENGEKIAIFSLEDAAEALQVKG